MKEYLTIGQASKLVGKHEDTIRKLAKENPNKCRRDENHKNAYLIPKDLVLAKYGAKTEGKKVEIHSEGSVDSELVKELRSRIQYLEKQIEDYKARESENDKRLDNIVDTLSKSLDQQQRLTGLQLTAGNGSEMVEITDTRHNEEERLTKTKEQKTIKKEEGLKAHKWHLFRKKI